jgi:hypothetical protein
MAGPISQAVAAERRAVPPGELPALGGFAAPPDRPYMVYISDAPLMLPINLCTHAIYCVIWLSIINSMWSVVNH